jgi:MerR family Zn(II)-responsive transcriptional regulator of zntA
MPTISSSGLLMSKKIFDPEVYFKVYTVVNSNRNHNMNQNLIKIGELAKRTDISVETLRYYEKEHLIKPQLRTESGYRLYSLDDENRLNFVLHAKKVGFSLSEIKKLLNLRLNKDSYTCEEVKIYTGQKITEVESKIADLQKMHDALSSLYKACSGGQEKATNCAILSTLDDESFFKRKIAS